MDNKGWDKVGGNITLDQVKFIDSGSLAEILDLMTELGESGRALSLVGWPTLNELKCQTCLV